MRRERSVTVAELDSPNASQDDAAIEAAMLGEEGMADLQNMLGDLSDEVIEDSDEEGSDDELAEVLKRAKAKVALERAAGNPIASMGAAPSSSSAALGLEWGSPEVRKSGRVAGAGKKEKDLLPPKWESVDGLSSVKGKLGILALQKEKLDREKSGADDNWKRSMAAVNFRDSLVSRPVLLFCPSPEAQLNQPLCTAPGRFRLGRL